MGQDDRPEISAGFRRAALALNLTAQTRAAGRTLEAERIPVLVLKGPLLQERLFSEPDRYPSADTDLLVAKEHAKRARGALVGAGWRFLPGNGLLWTIARQATFIRDQVALDLHWGIKIGEVAAFAFVPVEHALWENAQPIDDGLYEPDAESLLVFLILHAAGHRFARADWDDAIEACREQVRAWERVWHIARSARAESLVRAVVAGEKPTSAWFLDGAAGRSVVAASWLIRGRFVPVRLRDGLRNVAARRRRSGNG